MSEMVERVARAICYAYCTTTGVRDGYKMSPEEAHWETETQSGGLVDYDAGAMVGEGTAGEVWREMLDAALNSQ